MSNMNIIPEDIRNEFEIDGSGRASTTQRGLARIIGVPRATLQDTIAYVRDGRKTLSDPLSPFAGQDFGGGRRLSDVFAAALIDHFADKGYEQAQKVRRAFTAIGFNSWVQRELGWIAPPPGYDSEKVLKMAYEIVERDRKLREVRNFVADDLVKTDGWDESGNVVRAHTRKPRNGVQSRRSAEIHGKAFQLNIFGLRLRVDREPQD